VPDEEGDPLPGHRITSSSGRMPQVPSSILHPKAKFAIPTITKAKAETKKATTIFSEFS